MTAKNTFRGTVGVDLGWKAFNLFADYSVGSTAVIAGGLSFGM
jgi:hypothetical protein